MRILKREKIVPIIVNAFDSISLHYGDKQILTHMPEKSMVVTEAIIFEADEALKAELGIEDAIGGMFVEESK